MILSTSGNMDHFTFSCSVVIEGFLALGCTLNYTLEGDRSASGVILTFCGFFTPRCLWANDRG
jgi:hypothetical protein